MEKINNNILVVGENKNNKIGIDLEKNPCLLIVENSNDLNNKLSLNILDSIAKGTNGEVKTYSISKFKYKNKTKISELDDIYDFIKELRVEGNLIKRKLIRANCNSIVEYNRKYHDLKINQNIIYLDITSEVLRDISPLQNEKLDKIRKNMKYLIENAREFKIKFIIDINNIDTVDKELYKFLIRNCLLIKAISNDLYSINPAEKIFYRS